MATMLTVLTTAKVLTELTVFTWGGEPEGGVLRFHDDDVDVGRDGVITAVWRVSSCIAATWWAGAEKLELQPSGQLPGAEKVKPMRPMRC